jgi:hypothetical protein
MRLANEQIVLTVGRETIALRPSLRAAMRLDQRHGGFHKLANAIAEQNVSAMADVIRESAYSAPELLQLLEETADPNSPVLAGVNALVAPLVRFVSALAGADESEDHGKAVDNKASGKPMSFADYHLALYRIGTGRLGWTPDVTLNATAREIVEAYKGRTEFLTELLEAVFGGKAEEDGGFNPMKVERDHAGFAALKAAALTGQNKHA